MRKLLLTFLLLFCLTSSAQTWEWASKVNIGGYDDSQWIGTDKADNIYVLGEIFYYSGGSSNGYYYPILYKLNANGNLLWHDTLTSGAANAVLDSNANLYFANGPYLIKYDSSGHLVWNKYIANSSLYNIAISQSNYLIVAGCVPGNVHNSLLYKFDLNGNLIWTKTGIFDVPPKSMITDGVGSLYTVSSGPHDSTGNGGYLMKIDSSGTVLFSKTIPNYLRDISLDAAQNIYVCGWFGPINTIYIDDTTIQAQHTQHFLIKYDQYANVIWYKIIQGDLSTKVSLAVDSASNVYLSGSYVDFTYESYNFNALSDDIYVMHSDSSGNILSIKTSEGQSGQSNGYDDGGAHFRNICVNSAGEPIITATGSCLNYFDNIALNLEPSYGELIIAKIDPSGAFTEIAASKSKERQLLSVFPNPSSGTFQIIGKNAGKGFFQLRIIDAKGNLVYAEQKDNSNSEFQKEINLSNHPKGIYFVELLSAEGSSTRKIIID
jgi:hypothetical protein